MILEYIKNLFKKPENKKIIDYKNEDELMKKIYEEILETGEPVVCNFKDGKAEIKRL